MGLLPPLTHFFSLIREDPRIGPAHISLYMALLERWSEQEGKTPLLFSAMRSCLCVSYPAWLLTTKVFVNSMSTVILSTSLLIIIF